MSNIRPTKKQKELLDFIRNFISEHGYSPSYREIMDGAGYTSVATVAEHVNNLIGRGHLRKRDRSARSLEVVESGSGSAASGGDKERWLVERIEAHFVLREANPAQAGDIDPLYVLVGTLKILGMPEYQHYAERLNGLRKHK